MAFEAAFLELMKQSIAVRHFSKATTAGSSQGTYGTPTYASTQATYRGRLVQKLTKLIRPDGVEYTGTHVAWLHTTAFIGQSDKVTYLGTTFEVLSVGHFPDEDGQHHTKLVLAASTL